MATIKNIHDYSDIINRPYKKSKKYNYMFGIYCKWIDCHYTGF